MSDNLHTTVQKFEFGEILFMLTSAAFIWWKLQ